MDSPAGNEADITVARAQDRPLSPPSIVWTAVAPAAFVVLWSTGFIGAKSGLPYAEPLTFLTIRFAIAAALMIVGSLLVGAPWPRDAMIGHNAMVGLLMHSSCLGGVFSAISLGLPAGLTALVIGLQPILTAMVAGPLLGEHVRAPQWLGLLLGLTGAALVLGERYGFSANVTTWLAPALAVWGLIGITAGTLYQKRFCSNANLWTGTVVQYVAAAIPLGLLAWRLETMRVTWSGPFIASLAWLTVVLSVGSVTLLYLLIRRGAVSRLASLFFLIPPTTALIAWAMFGETLGLQALAGMAIASVGVALVQRG